MQASRGAGIGDACNQRDRDQHKEEHHKMLCIRQNCNRNNECHFCPVKKGHLHHAAHVVHEKQHRQNVQQQYEQRGKFVFYNIAQNHPDIFSFWAVIRIKTAKTRYSITLIAR